MNLSRQKAQEARKSEVDHREIREIRENRVALVRVFRLVRGEEVSFLSVLSLFAANQLKCLSMNHLHAILRFPDQAQSTLIKIFSRDQPRGVSVAAEGFRRRDADGCGRDARAPGKVANDRAGKTRAKING
jgi:hypothetical protein